MMTIEQYHDRAMRFVDQAIVAERVGKKAAAIDAYIQALQYETKAAEILRDQRETEPSRSVLYRSAASIAIRCKQYREAERLIELGLGGNPPTEIADELHHLRKQIPAEQPAI